MTPLMITAASRQMSFRSNEMGATVKFYISEILSVIALYLFLYVVLAFLLTAYGTVALWYLIWIACMGGAVALTWLVANQREGVNRLSTFLAIAAAAVLALGCLTLFPHGKNTIGYYTLLLSFIVVPGVSLGTGAVRLFLGPWRPLTRKALAVGAIAGVIGVVMIMLIMNNLGAAKLFVGMFTIPVVDIFGFDPFSFLGLQSGIYVRRTLLQEPLGELKLGGGLLFFLALLFQGVQSALAAIWDTLVLGVGAFATSWAGTRLLLRGP
ncbi:hypothetical protein [Chelatococcus asaccharovorans]|uniref:Uncharacterized protein n=1 Tax=Chelatococcus asaccharovorans TaxID=28210 RepID=A0A2V3TT31_9HYPH|nr:hypothetical protein [Chelatococcus asaccharovorans]MBS7707906.1 hypothetical protein [Chelatococcus asaccharovorans]PXW51156.1 hypothetical protein C7450_12147 [Chelatococcus asaccharovorans]